MRSRHLEGEPEDVDGTGDLQHDLQRGHRHQDEPKPRRAAHEENGEAERHTGHMRNGVGEAEIDA